MLNIPRLFLIFSTPFLLASLINFLTAERTAEAASTTWVFIAYGLAYSFALFFADFSLSLFIQHLFNLVNTYWIRVEEALMSAIFKKTMRLSPEAKQEFTTGEIVNLMSVDARRVAVLFIWIHFPLYIACVVFCTFFFAVFSNF